MEEVLHLGASAGEIAEILDVGVLMGGTLAMKSVRHAYAVIDAIRQDASAKGANR